MSRQLAFLLVVFAAFAPARSAQVPTSSPPLGLWWEISAAAGGARLTCGVCDPSRELGPSVGVAIGAHASPSSRVGIEGGVWTHQDGDVRESVYRAGVVTQLHLKPGSGLHLIAGLGWSGYRAEDFTYDAIRLTFGAGWDLPLTAAWVAGNRVTLDGSSYGALKNAGTTVVSSVGLSVLRFGVYVRRR